jgi:hypothetical protein
MPVPPGDYGVKGICAPARKWEVDGEWHAITPKWAGGASSWLPPPEKWQDEPPVRGDPVNSPMSCVAVGENGVAVFCYQYMENGRQYAMIDLRKPAGYDQLLRTFNSGGAGGGTSVATDGETAWAYSTDGGAHIVLRTDEKSFGSSPGALRRNSYAPPGAVEDLLAVRSADKTQTRVYVAQHRKLALVSGPGGAGARTRRAPMENEFVNQITIHDGADGRQLGQFDIPHPKALGVAGDALHLHHQPDGKRWAVSTLPLRDGLPAGPLARAWDVPPEIQPFDMKLDPASHFYLSDPRANKVYQLDRRGKITRAYGRLPVQKPGAYDRETMMEPEKIALWTDAQGRVRLLVVEKAGPNRVSEWDAATGALLRDFMSHQTKANDGYAIDPADASIVYVSGQHDWLTRFKIDYATREWTVDAVWPDVKSGQRRGIDKPHAIRRDGRLYLAGAHSFTTYRFDPAKNLWLKSADIIDKDGKKYFWNDANGNGAVDDAELRPTVLPGWVLTYHGQKWLADLSYIAAAQGGRDVWRAAPSGFDAHGNPVFERWEKVLTDPVFTARAENRADALHGGNELDDRFSSDWMQVDGLPGEGYYVQARGGRSFTANFGAQHKISRYVPDGKNGFRLKWRVGRSAMRAAPERGELEGAMRIFKPINGLLSVIDQSRSGVALYTDEGLYVDTLFPPVRVRAGLYHQPGEFFAGTVYANAQNGKIYYATGKYTPFLYEIEGWSARENPVRPLALGRRLVSIGVAQIADPPEIALALRGGAGVARLARFAPALGGVALDGSPAGWESAPAAIFSSSKEKTVEVRTLYTPDALLLRWHVRAGGVFKPAPLPAAPERIWTHNQEADTVGFYIQGDPGAPAKGPDIGRPGDARFVFGIFNDAGKPRVAALGMYPHYPLAGASPQVYRTPVGEAAFAHVAEISGVKTGHAIDADGRGFVIAASIPRAALPALKTPFGADLKTLVNFDANLGGHDRFWWADTDGSANRETYDEPSEARLYPGSWAPARFQGVENGATAPRWLVLGPFGGPGAEKFNKNPDTKMKDDVRKFYERPVFPFDGKPLDFDATFSGEAVGGYWRAPARVEWRTVPLAELDTRAIIGEGSQLWYGATWIESPGEARVEFEFQGHPQTPIRWFLNGDPVAIPDNEYKRVPNDDPQRHLYTASRQVTLRKGRNLVHFRAYNFGYSPFRSGLVVKAVPETIWSLRFAADLQK